MHSNGVFFWRNRKVNAKISTLHHITFIALLLVCGLTQAKPPQNTSVIQSHFNEEIEVLGESPLTFPHLNEVYKDYKVRVKTTGEITGITLDSKNKPVNKSTLSRQNAQAKYAKYGSLSKELYEKVMEMGPRDSLAVIIWLDDAPRTPLVRFIPKYRDPNSEEHKKEAQVFKAKLLQMKKERTELIKTHAGPLLGVLRSLNARKISEGSSFPYFTSELTKAQILSLSHRKGITIYSDIDPKVALGEVMLRTTSQTIRAGGGGIPNDEFGLTPHSDTSTNDQGITGTATTIAISEFGSIKFDATGNNRLKGANREDDPANCMNGKKQPDGSVFDLHATPVAAVANHRNNGCTTTPDEACNSNGIAYRGRVLGAHTCNDADTETERYRKAMEWAFWNNDARILNRSIQDTTTALGPFSRIYDEIVYLSGLNVVAAAGNVAFGSSDKVTEPGIAYNVITVGNSYVHTPGNLERLDDPIGWSDDTLLDSSNHINPVSGHSDREKPDVAAPGTLVMLPNGTGGYGPYTGTSFAAPAVAGTIALMQQRNSIFRYFPALTKAVLAATAWNNPRGPAYPKVDGYDDHDGAGVVVASRTNKLAKAALVSGEQVVDGFGSKPVELVEFGVMEPPWSIVDTFVKVYASPGDLIRVALAWSVDPNYQNYDNDPSADLDIIVVRPDGSQLPYEYTWDSNLEVREFQATQTGYYTFKINKYQIAVDTPYGIAVDKVKGSSLASPRDKDDPV